MTITATVPPVPSWDKLEPQLREVGTQLTKWTARRDKLIRQAAEQGVSLRTIGEAVGLSHTAVRFIVSGRPPR